MSGGDLPPRQKMIGMMYLVLTALLAMNVSKDILDAFIVVNTGIENTTTTFGDKTSAYYAKFSSAAQDDPIKSGPFRDKANNVKKWSDELYNHIAALKKELIRETDKLPEGAHDSLFLIKNVQSKDNYDIPSHAMGLADPASPQDGEWSAVALRKKMNKYKTDLLGLFKENKEAEDAMKKALAVLDTPDPKSGGDDKNWESANFYHVPLAAVVTILSKFQSDVRSAEAEAVAKLYENIDAGSVSFSDVDGFAFAKKAYVMDGDSFAAQIFTAAYDKLNNPEIFIGKVDSAAWKNKETDEAKLMKGTKGNTWSDFTTGGWFQLKDVKEGKGYLKIRESVGIHDWGGIIKVKTKKGIKIYPFENSFEVGKPSTTVAADKMNVFYIGVDNPVSVSAPMPNFTASGPGLTKTSKGYNMRPPAGAKEVTIVVTGTDDNGNKVNLGKSVFRVKKIPDPVASIVGKSGSFSIQKSALLGAATVQAKMEGFDFEVNVSVSSFKFSTIKSGMIADEQVTGNKLSEKCRSFINGGTRNQKFYIEDIKVKMPDGTTRTLAPIILQVI